MHPLYCKNCSGLPFVANPQCAGAEALTHGCLKLDSLTMDKLLAVQQHAFFVKSHVCINLESPLLEMDTLALVESACVHSQTLSRCLEQGGLAA